MCFFIWLIFSGFLKYPISVFPAAELVVAILAFPSINVGYHSLEEDLLSTYLFTSLSLILLYLATAVTNQVVSQETIWDRPSPALTEHGGSLRCLPLKSGCPCHLGLLSGSSSYVAYLPRRNR